MPVVMKPTIRPEDVLAVSDSYLIAVPAAQVQAFRELARVHAELDATDKRLCNESEALSKAIRDLLAGDADVTIGQLRELAAVVDRLLVQRGALAPRLRHPAHG